MILSPSLISSRSTCVIFSRKGTNFIVLILLPTISMAITGSMQFLMRYLAKIVCH